MALDTATRNALEYRVLAVVDVAIAAGDLAIEQRGNNIREWLYEPLTEAAAAYGLVKRFEQDSASALDARADDADGAAAVGAKLRQPSGATSSAPRAPVPATAAPTAAVPIKAASLMGGNKWLLILGVAAGAFFLVKRARPNPPSHGWWVVVVDGDPYDSHAARTREAAIELANPDDGAQLTVYSGVRADDAGAARLPSVYRGAKSSRVVFSG